MQFSLLQVDLDRVVTHSDILVTSLPGPTPAAAGRGISKQSVATATPLRPQDQRLGHLPGRRAPVRAHTSAVPGRRRCALQVCRRARRRDRARPGIRSGAAASATRRRASDIARDCSRKDAETWTAPAQGRRAVRRQERVRTGRKQVRQRLPSGGQGGG
jgi:hypothetical protein